MSHARSQPNLTSTADLVEGLMFYPVALVISATALPGLTLCIPGLIFVTVLVLIPLVAIAIVLLLGAAALAAPVLLVRGIRGLLERRAASKSPSRERVQSPAAAAHLTLTPQ
jgi:hypothetical protein